MPFFNIGEGSAEPNIVEGQEVFIEIESIEEEPNEDGEAIKVLYFKDLETGKEFKTTQKIMVSRAEIALKNSLNCMQLIYSGLQKTAKGGKSYHNFECKGFNL